jgi:hypothetical protein
MLAMKAPRFGAIILYTSRIDEVVRFYRAAGLPVEEERHEDDLAHFACEIGDIHFAIFEADG